MRYQDLSYDRSASENLHLKIEPYYQYLYLNRKV